MKEDNSSVREKKVKRTKSQTDVLSPSANGSVPAAASAIVDSFFLEEEAAHHRTTQDDFQLFKETCSKIREHMKTMLLLPRNKRNEVEAAECQLQASLLFLELKQLNRLDKHRSKRIRDAVNEAKQKVDNYHLQLQNMLYEVMHLEKEVTKCFQFRSKDEEIELVPVEEFYREAPLSISRPNETESDGHQQTLARLEWELEQRKRLAEKLRATENAKQMYLQEIDKKRDCLDNLQPNLRSIMEATQPLHQELGMPLQANQLKHKSAEYLPRPLYVLYVQTSAYREACDKKGLFVDVDGNPEEAKLLLAQAEDVEEESGDSDQEEASKKRHRRSLSEKKESNKKVLASHPLSVSVQVKVKGSSVTICFRYLIHLNIITATVTDTQFQSQGGISAGQVLQADTLLTCLFSKDDGRDSPNPANHFELKKSGIDGFENCTSEVGFAYQWAQHLGGLEFLPLKQQEHSGSLLSGSSVKREHSLSASRVELTITAIKERMVSRLALHQQLLTFEQLSICVPNEATSHFPAKVNARFKEWKLTTWDEVLCHPSSKPAIEMEIIHDGMSVYSALFERGSAKMKALVLVSIDYPKTSPFFLLTLLWKGYRTSSTDTGIWELEELLNVCCPERYMPDPTLRLHILSLQLRQLLVAFDIYLETEAGCSDSLEGPKEFSPSWAFARITKGRNRSRPYQYIKKLDIFT